MIFPPFELVVKLRFALGIGLLVGSERQWSAADVGVRTFSIRALLGLSLRSHFHATGRDLLGWRAYHGYFSERGCLSYDPC